MISKLFICRFVRRELIKEAILQKRYFTMLSMRRIFICFKKILRFILFPFTRLLLSFTLKKYIRTGVTEQKVGTWSQHINEWKAVAVSKKQSCRFAFISYEALLAKPESSIRSILNALDLDPVSDEWIKKAIKEESFDRMKSRLNPNSNPIDVSKLRTGKKDDWKNYLSDANLNLIASSNINDTYVV